MDVIEIWRPQCAIEQNWHSDRFGYLLARVRKRRRRQHDANGKARPRLKAATGPTHHPAEKRVPAKPLQRAEHGISRIAEAAGELERPDALLVDDGIEVHIAH